MTSLRQKRLCLSALLLEIDMQNVFCKHMAYIANMYTQIFRCCEAAANHLFCWSPTQQFFRSSMKQNEILQMKMIQSSKNRGWVNSVCGSIRAHTHAHIAHRTHQMWNSDRISA